MSRIKFDSSKRWVACRIFDNWLKRESLSDIRLSAWTGLNVEFIRFRKKNAGFKFSICEIFVLFVFRNFKFSFQYKEYYCIYLHFNSRLSEILHSTQRLLVVECRKATHAWAGYRKIRHSITSKIWLESNRIILLITGFFYNPKHLVGSPRATSRVNSHLGRHLENSAPKIK